MAQMARNNVYKLRSISTVYVEYIKSILVIKTNIIIFD